MKSSISMSDIALGLTIFVVSILCSSSRVMGSENESGLPGQDMVMVSGGGGSGASGGASSSITNSRERFSPGLGGGLNERYFRNYYEMLHDTEPVWKRAPAAGFFGMRGKKVPSSTFYGMRGKKGPSGFLGMRGKKSQDSVAQQLALANAGMPLVDLVSIGPGTGLKMKGPGAPGPILSSSPGGGLMDSYDDYSLFGVTGPSAGFISPYKRAPAEGFMGLRGKRSVMDSEPISYSMGRPARSYQ